MKTEENKFVTGNGEEFDAPSFESFIEKLQTNSQAQSDFRDKIRERNYREINRAIDDGLITNELFDELKKRKANINAIGDILDCHYKNIYRKFGEEPMMIVTKNGSFLHQNRDFIKKHFFVPILTFEELQQREHYVPNDAMDNIFEGNRK